MLFLFMFDMTVMCFRGLICCFLILANRSILENPCFIVLFGSYACLESKVPCSFQSYTTFSHQESVPRIKDVTVEYSF